MITIIAPEPNNEMNLTNGIRYGLVVALRLRRARGIHLRHARLHFLFCASLSTFIPSITTSFKIVNSAYLVWFARGVWCSSGNIELAEGPASFCSGALSQFVKVKIYIYCIMAMQTYMLAVAGFAVFLAFAAILCTLCWLVFGTNFPKIFSAYAKPVGAIWALGPL